MKAVIARLIEGREFESFRITARRAFKSYPLTSVELNRELGAFVLGRARTRVDLERPALTITVEVLPDQTFVYLDRQPGPGGLPVGSSGSVAALLSGGIDSPVAAWRMMRRGCPVEVVLATPAAARVVVYRRLMVRIAEALARAQGALALATGESLGQVASQTLENISRIDEVAALPILRPLIGMDKLEIVGDARHLGTFDISIEPDQDCCSLFVPPHPATRLGADEVARLEARLDVGRLVQAGVDGAACETFEWPVSVAPAVQPGPAPRAED